MWGLAGGHRASRSHGGLAETMVGLTGGTGLEGESEGLVGGHRAGRSHGGLAGATWYLRNLPVAGDLPPEPPQHCLRGSRATGAGTPGGPGAGLSPWRGRTRPCRAGWAQPSPSRSPAPPGAAGQVLPGVPWAPCPAPAGAPLRGLRVPPPRPPPFYSEAVGDTTTSSPAQKNPRVGWDFGHPRGTVLPSRVSPACGGDVGDTAAPPRKKTPNHG